MRAAGTLEPEARAIATLVPPGGTALDIGANHGVYSYFMVRHFDRVVAFEPQATCVATLRSWARGRVDIRQVALSDHQGGGRLAIPVRSGVPLTGYARLDSAVDGDSSYLDVPVERLDDQRLRDVRFVKIDVEGHEMAVLRGGERLLDSDRPVLLVEIEQRHLDGGQTIAGVVDYLADRGYGCVFRSGDGWTEFGEFRLESHQDPAQVGRPGYVNMFLFLPDGSRPGTA
ncbi:MAG TPA: FkbM family methyltransferase [Acidimicrobiales bacterium]|nr:FkbM family methyltransferase [Acidimicrobiales bacterium]